MYDVVTGYAALIPDQPDIEICFIFEGQQIKNRGAYIDNVQLIQVLPFTYHQLVSISKIMLS